MKIIRGYVYNQASNSPIENVVISNKGSGSNGAFITELSNSRGEFTITVPDETTALYFYKVGTGTEGESYFYIPNPIPAVWNIGLVDRTLPELVIRPEEPEKKMKLWPVYAGVGLLALLLIRKMRKKKKRK